MSVLISSLQSCCEDWLRGCKFPTYEPSSLEFSKMHTCVHLSITWVSSQAWHALSRVSILYKWLCVFVPYYAVLFRGKGYSTFISSPGCTQTSLDRFFKKVDRIESSNKPEPVSSMSGLSKIPACPPSPVADDPSAPPSVPTPVGNSSCLFTPCQPLCASCYTRPLYFSRYCTLGLKMCSLFFVSFFNVLFVWKLL